MFELTLRPATPADVSVLLDLIMALAEYEKLSHAVTGTVEALKEHLFGANPDIEAIVAEYAGQAAGFALFFHNYSTFLAKPGIYLEDLFVLPQFRRLGIGKAVLSYLAQLAVSRNCGRFEWSVLDWNESAIAFYKRMGASILESTRICRLTEEPLTELASNNSSLKVRPATPEDTPTLFHLLQGKAEFDQKLDTLTGTPEALQRHLFGEPSYIEAILAESEGEVVGFATFFPNYSTFLTRQGLYVDDLFILPSHRRQGLGKAMLGHLAQLAVKRDCGRLEWLVAVWNDQAIAFYKRMGASVLPDWRICRVADDKLTQLAAQLGDNNQNLGEK
ncbi:Histone acetyltransferase HPA2 and related acetyltransferases [uncultured Coleofasciculus sp.]|uniref:Histone acetyltransferase HPA2 and related acetyltransferases n=1 Tax=uncultured Coleofasciculus sp. TaxID=1267456 RepID=A0A6J4JUX2_9CYAN|nr:Histone acetyltransferase HPA2 and related acetyltransferases [uncultured Coleofasciculus sp.]